MNKYWRWKTVRFVAELGLVACVVFLMVQGQIIIALVISELCIVEIFASIKVDDHRALSPHKPALNQEIA